MSVGLSLQEEDARWKGGDSEDEDAPRAPEAEEGSEGEAMEVPARKKGGGGGKGAGNNERYVLPTLDANLKKLFQDALTSKPKKSKLVEEEEAKAKDIVRVRGCGRCCLGLAAAEFAFVGADYHCLDALQLGCRYLGALQPDGNGSVPHVYGTAFAALTWIARSSLPT